LTRLILDLEDAVARTPSAGARLGASTVGASGRAAPEPARVNWFDRPTR
jgi:hypothetical protein